MYSFLSEVFDGFNNKGFIAIVVRIGTQHPVEPGMRKRCISARKLLILEMFSRVASAQMTKEIAHIGADGGDKRLIRNIGLNGIHNLCSLFQI
jgi:hypothetical protein